MKTSFNNVPKGKCDMCNTRKAAYWFGQTSVALCGDDDCSERNKLNWNRMLEEEEADRKYREERGWD